MGDAMDHRVEILRGLLERLRSADAPSQELDAHVVCASLAPAGSFVSFGPISGRYRVCVGESERGKDMVWEDWIDWRFVRLTASIEASLELMKRALPGAMWAVGCMEGGPFCRLVYPTGHSNGWGHTVSLEQEGGPDSEPLAILCCLISAKLDLLTREHADEKNAAA